MTTCRAAADTNTAHSSHSTVIFCQVYQQYFFFFFRLLPLGVATADSPSPSCSLLCVFLRHFHCCQVLSYRVHKTPYRPSLFPLSWQLHRHPPSPNIPSIFPQYMCPNRLSLASRSFSPNHPTCAVPLMYSTTHS